MYGTTVRFSPRGGNQLSALNTLDAVNRVVEEIFGELARPGGQDAQGSAVRPWQPLVDIVETEQAYEVRAELPGVSREDVQLAIENNVLTVSGERKFEKDVNKENYHRVERAYGPFSRSFTLPSRLDTERVEAKFDNGLLTVVIPKAAESRPRKIEIG